MTFAVLHVLDLFIVAGLVGSKRPRTVRPLALEKISDGIYALREVSQAICTTHGQCVHTSDIPHGATQRGASGGTVQDTDTEFVKISGDANTRLRNTRLLTLVNLKTSPRHYSVRTPGHLGQRRGISAQCIRTDVSSLSRESKPEMNSNYSRAYGVQKNRAIKVTQTWKVLPIDSDCPARTTGTNLSPTSISYIWEERSWWTKQRKSVGSGATEGKLVSSAAGIKMVLRDGI
ncbi:hypothetical protein BDP27DRAFT_1364965 [Rhodocollybia butyracea]|uniref:Uncharacterized protein n=1 Tax=Rhodocollybia butyracea TaxID=206335 RepID=A0A9P5PKQ0_9AGAR|nr:hypothetical protein BDP27DRAFT_1364965 [Rhodocollybia butyracea]